MSTINAHGIKNGSCVSIIILKDKSVVLDAVFHIFYFILFYFIVSVIINDSLPLTLASQDFTKSLKIKEIVMFLTTQHIVHY